MGTAFPLLSYGENAYILLKIHFAVQKDVFLAKRIGGWGSAPDPAGELTTLPQTPSRLGRGHHPAQRLRRFDSRDFGARYLTPSTPRILRLRRSILAFPLLLIYEMTTVECVHNDHCMLVERFVLTEIKTIADKVFTDKGQRSSLQGHSNFDGVESKTRSSLVCHSSMPVTSDFAAERAVTASVNICQLLKCPRQISYYIIMSCHMFMSSLMWNVICVPLVSNAAQLRVMGDVTHEKNSDHCVPLVSKRGSLRADAIVRRSSNFGRALADVPSREIGALTNCHRYCCCCWADDDVDDGVRGIM